MAFDPDEYFPAKIPAAPLLFGKPMVRREGYSLLTWDASPRGLLEIHVVRLPDGDRWGYAGTVCWPKAYGCTEFPIRDTPQEAADDVALLLRNVFEQLLELSES